MAVPSKERADEIADHLGRYSICLLGASVEPDTRLELLGSGTLIELEGARYVLTATHVWDAISKFQAMALTLYPDDRSHSCVIKHDHLTVHWLPHPPQPSETEWGPDMCAILIPASRAATIAAVKSFYTIPTDTIEETVAFQDGDCCVLIGGPAEWSTQTDPAHTSLRSVAFFGDCFTEFVRHGRTYFDLTFRVGCGTGLHPVLAA